MYIDEINKDVSKEYIFDFEISTYDAGYGRYIKPSALLKFQQQAGEEHLRCFDLSYSQLYEKGMIFIATGGSLVIRRMPCLEEKLKIKTWNRGAKGVRFYRCYNWIDENGETVIEACSAFVLADPRNHSILRPDVFNEPRLSADYSRSNAAGDVKRIKMPDGLINKQLREIRYSDLDYNGHVNNTVYADIVADYIPGGITGKRMTTLSIDFLKEAKLGDVIEITTYTDNDTVYMKGVHSRGDCFTARCSLSPTELI